MKIKTQIAIALITNALTDKCTYVGVKAFVNTSRPSSTNDLRELLTRIRNGKEVLTKAHKDNNGHWHFTTV